MAIVLEKFFEGSWIAASSVSRPPLGPHGGSNALYRYTGVDANGDLEAINAPDNAEFVSFFSVLTSGTVTVGTITPKISNDDATGLNVVPLTNGALWDTANMATGNVTAGSAQVMFPTLVLSVSGLLGAAPILTVYAQFRVRKRRG